MYFVTYCQKILNFKHQTIKLYLAGIRHYYIRLEGFDPLANLKQERLPITSAVLRELCSILSKGVFSYSKDMMLECAFNLAFFGFLRCGEFTYRSQYDHEHVARLQDISFEKSHKFYVFHLRSSKCDPFGRGVKITIFENNVFKPVATMNKNEI